jgi:hypothetical protein
MSIWHWWRKQRLGKSGPSAKAPNEAGINARVDMVRFEAFAEAAYEAMYEARLYGAKDRYENARQFFERAIDAAHRAGLQQEAARLTRRRDHVSRIYNSQFRYSGG